MRTRRIKASPEASNGLYHCISRVVDRRLVFGDTEKEHFCRLLRGYARFCGVRILTHCVMGNHFHLLVEVPKRPDDPPDDDELIERIAAIHSPERTRVIGELLSRAGPVEREALRQRLWRRMGDISQFLKELKQRFSQWHNLRQGRHGTLWEERFKSVLIGPGGRALSTVAAYIDLNPVRAGLVSHPAAYRWSGCGGAVNGNVDALAGYRAMMALLEGTISEARQAFGRYRKAFLEDAHGRLGLAGKKVVQSLAPTPDSNAILAPTGTSIRTAGRPDSVPHGRVAQLMHRISIFSNGAVIGTRDFVESTARRLGLRQPFHRLERPGSRPLKGSNTPQRPSGGIGESPPGRSREGEVCFSLRACRT